MFVFACAGCGAELTVPVSPVALPPHARQKRKEGLVTSEPGPDARTRRIDLTERGRSLVPFLEAEWRATHATVAELDREVPYAMTAVVEEVRRALERRSMRQRILHHLVEPPR